MSRRRSMGRRGISRHRTYEIAEIANALGVCRGTVRNWLKQGLPAITDQRPHLVRGADLLAFLATKKQTRKRPMAIGEFYCFRCRDARPPAEGMVDHTPRNAKVARLSALCPECTAVMNRVVRKGDLAAWRACFAVHATVVEPTLTD